MLMKIKSSSKSQPKFYGKGGNASQPKLCFNDHKILKTNCPMKKHTKLVDLDNKENAVGAVARDFQSKQSSHDQEPHLKEDNDYEREKRRKEFVAMSEKVRILQAKLNQVKLIIEQNAQKRTRYKVNQEGKVNAVVKETINSTNRINSFVTQMKIPLQVTPHCSSESNLLSLKPNLKTGNHRYYVSTVVGAFNSRANTTFMQLCKTHLGNSLQLLNTLKNTQKPSEVRPVRLLKPTKRNTVIFDLDETLIHCNDNTNSPSDVTLDLRFPGGEQGKAGINVRSKAIQTLKYLSKYFQVIVFTASHECYGSMVCDFLDPNNEYISQRYYRDSCYKTKEGYYVKDLRVIDRPLEKMLLVDNAAYSYVFQIENGIPIIPFYDCKTDIELRHLTQYLMQFVDSSDMRVDHCRQMKVDEYSRFQHPVDLINQLYGDVDSK